MYQLSRLLGRIALATTIALLFCNASIAQLPSGPGIKVIPLDATVANTGDQVAFAIHLDASDTPNQMIKGFQLDLVLHPDVSWSGSPKLDLSHSDFPGVVTSEIQVIFGVEGKVTIKDSFLAIQQGTGEMGRFVLHIDQGPIHPDECMVDGGAGLIVVDDIGFKTLPDHFQVFPNPFRESLQFNWGDQEPKAIEIHDLQGKLVVRLEGEALRQKAWSPHTLSQNTYLVTIVDAEGNKASKIIIRE